jgi:hypothetical protein
MGLSSSVDQAVNALWYCGADRQYLIPLCLYFRVAAALQLVKYMRKRLWGTTIWHGKYMVLIRKVGR